MVSRSADGDVLAALLARWGFDVVRGSSSEGGRDALRTMVDAAREGRSVLITPDGPRGPAREFKIGALVAAQRAAVPLVLCHVSHSRAWRLRSWDSFEIPKPFSRVTVRYDEPITVDPACVDDCLDRLRASVEEQLGVNG